MSTNRPTTFFFPLGLFCAATLSVPPPNPIETASLPFPLDRELLDMPAIAPGADGLNDDVYWDDGSA